MKHIHKIAALTGLLLVFSACVTHKKKGETGFLNKRYQNLTAKYNGYFNANVLYEDALAKLTTTHQDNYNQILDVYPYEAVSPEEAKSVASDMDNAVKKLSSVLALHRVSDWSDDCYLLAGKSQFLKQDYESAEETFRFALEEFNPNKKLTKGGKKIKKSASEKKQEAKDKKKAADKKKKEKEAAKKAKEKARKKAKKQGKKLPKTTEPTVPKKEKKEDEQPEKRAASGKNPNAGNFFHRRRAYPDLQLWMGRTLIERDKYEEAEFLFNQLAADPFFPTELWDDLAAAQAHNYLKQKEYARAVEPLERAISLTKKKRDRARLAYILAQLQSKAGNSEQAVAAYEKVLKSNPNYDMEFSARLHMTLDGFYTGKTDENTTADVLKKMLKDGKNSDYKDQIYFVLAQIDLKKGDKTTAISDLQKSLAFSKNNKNQKAESYYLLANLYFEKENFVAAKNYFDSTLLVLPNTDERYKSVAAYAKNLKDVAAYISLISLNDSLRTIYNMSDDDKKKLAARLKKEREKAVEAAAAPPVSAVLPKTGPIAQLGKPSNFYFYNDAALKKGKKDFAKIWGDDRANVDNWRRSQRTGENSAADGSNADAGAEKSGISNEEITDLFRGVPTNAKEMAALDSVTAATMFKLGKAYRDQLENNKRCTETLEKMLEQYAQFVKRDELESWFYCYLAFTDLSNQVKSKAYFDKIVAKYPNSAYAKSLTDPNFRNLTSQRERDLNEFYNSTFQLFQNRKFQEAADKCADAEKKFGTTNVLQPKFALLAAMCQGSIIGKNGYCAALKEVIAKYPDSEVKTRATEIARLIGCDGFLSLPDPSASTPKKESGEEYALEDDKLHYFLIVLNGDELKLDNVKSDISDYNRQYHKLDQLRVSNIFLGTDTDNPIIVIRKFDNRESAMKYFDEITKANDFIKEKKVKREFFAITQNNYRVLLGKKRLDEYRSFFDEKYLKK